MSSSMLARAVPAVRPRFVRGLAFLSVLLACAACSGGGSSATSDDGGGGAGAVTVSPMSGIASSGTSGGAFLPSSRVYTLTNGTADSVSWLATSSESWLLVASGATGTLAPGDSGTVTVEIDETVAGALADGTHDATLSLVDAGDATTFGAFACSVTVAAVDASGWTEFTESSDTRIVYVSSQLGNDANDGLSEGTPKETISAGLALMRQGFPDWLLLRRGDVFDTSDIPPSGYKWNTAGRSESEPQLFSTYGPHGAGRARIETAGKTGLRFNVGGTAPPTIEHVAIVGIEFDARPRDVLTQTPTGIRLQMNLDDILLEDCKITHFADGVIAQLNNGLLTNIRVRRNVIANCYAGDGSHAQGLYCDEVDGMLIEENVIDHGGWTTTDGAADAPDIFKHDIYVQGDGLNVVVRGNILSRASSHGLQLRPGGVANDNLFLGNPVGLLIGGNGEARGNVILDGQDISPSLPRRQALHCQNVSTGVQITHNIIANSTPSSSSKAMSILPLDEGGTVLGVSNLVIAHNVVSNWGGEALDIRNFASPLATFVNAQIRDNDFQNLVDAQELVQHQSTDTPSATSMSGNRYYSASTPTNAWMRVGTTDYTLTNYLALVGDSSSSATHVAYPNASATIATYNASLGGVASLDAFLEQALLQSRDNWRSQYTAEAAIAYFRDAFAVADY